MRLLFLKVEVLSCADISNHQCFSRTMWKTNLKILVFRILSVNVIWEYATLVFKSRNIVTCWHFQSPMLRIMWLCRIINIGSFICFMIILEFGYEHHLFSWYCNFVVKWCCIKRQETMLTMPLISSVTLLWSPIHFIECWYGLVLICWPRIEWMVKQMDSVSVRFWCASAHC